MAIRLLDTDGAEQLRCRINSDPEFGLVSRDMTLNLTIEVDGELPVLLRVTGVNLAPIGDQTPKPVHHLVRIPAPTLRHGGGVDQSQWTA